MRYVAFRANDYTSAVQVSEADMQDYYDANSHLYVSTDTNGVESVKPFEDVRDSIAAIFVDDAARRAAYEAAGKFADVFYSFDPAASVPDFDAEAARLGYTVVTTGLFSASSVPVRPSNPSEFAETAFSLLPRDGGNDSVSDAVFCGTESYVMALTTNVASYIPSLENVRLVVDNGVRREAVEREFRSKLDAVTEALALGLEKGGDFSAIAKEQGLKVETNMTFSVMSSYTKSDVPYARNIAGVMSGMDVGEFSAPIDIDNGAVIFRVADRQPPKDSSSIGMLGRQQIFGLLIPKKQELLWQSWLASNLSSMSFTTEMDVDGAGTEDYAE